MGLDVYLGTIGVGVLGAFLYFVLVKDKPYPHTFYLMFFLVTYVFAFENFCIYLFKSGYPNNNWYYTIFFVYIQSFIIYYFFYSIFEDSAFRRMIVYYIGIILIWGTINSVFFQPIDRLPQTYTYIVAALGIVFCCVYFFHGLLKGDKYQGRPLLALPQFWIVAAILGFYSSSFVLYLLMGIPNFIPPDIMGLFGGINRAIASTMYVIIGFSHFSTFLFSTKNGRQLI